MPIASLANLYLTLLGWVLLGFILGRILPPSASRKLGQFLFWVGVPISIIAFARQAQLSFSLWIAPVAAWAAILLGTGLAWCWLQQRSWNRPTQASFVLAAMVGNTGYLGYPIVLALVGPQYFAWALFCDMLGTTLGAYTLGVSLAAYFSQGQRQSWWLLKALLKNPALWSFGLGLGLRDLPLPGILEQSLQALAWIMLNLSLVLIGMRLGQLSSWKAMDQALTTLGIKMLLVPCVIGIGLSAIGIGGFPRLVIVLQTAMPPAFATLVLAEAYNLDQELTVTALTIGSLGILLTLPLWLLLFSP